MRSTIIAALLTSSLLFQAAPAQADMASDAAKWVGKKMLSSVLSAVVGDGLAAIFGGDDPDALTKEDLQQAIADGFNNAALSDINVNVDNLRRDIDDYTPETTAYAVAYPALTDYKSNAAQIQSAVIEHMSGANFMTLVPSYVIAANTRLMLLAEIRRSQFASDGSQQNLAANGITLAAAAEEAIHELADMFYNDFGDPDLGWDKFKTSDRCITTGGGYYYNEVGMKMARSVFGPSGNGTQLTQYDISGAWCPGKNGELFVYADDATDGLTQTDGLRAYLMAASLKGQGKISKIEVWKVVSSNIYKVSGRDVYTVVSRVPVTGGHSWRYTTHSTKLSAQLERVAATADAYPDQLGAIKEQVKTWFDIVVAVGSDEQKLEAAQASLGFVSHEYLGQHAPGFSAWYQTTGIPMILGQTS